MSLQSFIISRRYLQQIYTKAGEILIIEPYKLVLDKMVLEYMTNSMKKYREGKCRAWPHIFETSNDVYQQIINSRKNQSIIISGESGAGKTERQSKLCNTLLI